MSCKRYNILQTNILQTLRYLIIVKNVVILYAYCTQIVLTVLLVVWKTPGSMFTFCLKTEPHMFSLQDENVQWLDVSCKMREIARKLIGHHKVSRGCCFLSSSGNKTSQLPRHVFEATALLSLHQLALHFNASSFARTVPSFYIV